jgi:hypothetical protein
MSKHAKVVSVSIDARAKKGLRGAGKSVAEVVTAVVLGSDDSFGQRRNRTE